MANPFLKDYLEDLIQEEERKLSWGADSPAAIPLIPEEQAQPEKNMAWDIIGSTLYSFADEAAFGGVSLGAYALDVDTETFRPQGFAAKLGSGIGTLGGFAVGLPMKVGGKIISAAATPFLKKAVKELGEDFVVKGAAKYSKEVAKEATELGIKTDISKGFTNQFLNMSNRATFNKGLAKNFAEKSSQGIDELAAGYLTAGKISADEAKIITTLFKEKLTKRPLQNFKDLFSIRGKNPHWGNLLDEALMFGAIDAIREVPMHIAQEREYDKFAPLWGVGIGAGFGALKFMSPAGKGSNFRIELTDGIKAAFGKNIYKGKKTEDLLKHSSWLHNQMKDNGDELLKTYRTVKVGGKDYKFDLELPSQAINDYGSTIGKKVLAQGLDEYSKSYGKEVLNFAIKEEWGSLSENFFRMVGGSIMMSAHSIYEVAAHDADIALDDILPGILIGGWMNRRGTPRVYDMHTRTNKIRKNLTVLGHDTRNLVDIPSYNPYNAAYMNPIEQNETLRKVRDKAEELGIITDSYEQSSAPIIDGSESVMMRQQTKGGYDLYSSFHRLLGGQKKFIKELDNISTKDADQLQLILKEAKWDALNNRSISDPKDLGAVLQSVSEGAAGVFERNLTTTLLEMREALNIPSDLKIDLQHMGTFPKELWIPLERNQTNDPTLREYAENGKLIEGKSGEEAWNIVKDTVSKANHIISSLSAANRITLNTERPKTNDATGLRDPEGFRKLQEIVDGFESRVNQSVNSGSGTKFSIKEHMGDLETLMVFNNAKTSARNISNLFGQGMAGHEELQGALRSAGLLHGDVVELKSILNVGEANIKITGTEDATDAKRFLNSVLSIINAKGQYSRSTPEHPIEIDIAEINSLKEYLGKRGMNTGLMQMDQYNNFTIDFIEREIISGTNLSMNDMHTVHSINGLEGFGLINYSTTGGRGFEIRKINEVKGDAEVNRNVSRYNQFVDNLMVKGKSETGNLFSTQDPIVITNREALNELNRRLDYADADAFVASKQALTDFVNGVKSKHPAFVNQMLQFAQSNKGYSEFLMKWLSDNKIIERKAGDSYIKYHYNEEGLTDDVIALLKSNMNEYGVSFDRAEAQYNQNREKVLDMISEGYSYTHQDISLTQDQFFNKYLTDTDGAPIYSKIEAQNDWLNNIVSLSKSTGKLVSGAAPGKGFKTGLRSFIEGPEFKFKVGDKYKEFSELDMKNQSHENVVNGALDDLTSLLTSKMNAVEVPMFIWDGRSNYRTTVMQRGHLNEAFDQWGLTLGFISGSAENFVQLGNKMERRRFSLFEGESKYLSQGDKELAQNQLQAFESDLNNLTSVVKNRFRDGFTPESELIDNGVSIFRVANGFQPMAIMNHQLPKIAEAYAKLIEKTKGSLSDSLVKEMRDTLKDMIANPTAKSGAHEKALRQLLFEKISTEGSDISQFTELMTHDKNNNGDLDKISKRFSLYHTPNFKKIVPMIAEGTARNKSDQAILDKFLNRGTVKVAIWDDKGYSSIRNNLERAIGKDAATEFWNNELHNRGDESAFDSITYMSKEQMRFWSLGMGRAGKNESQLFKPAISSAGDVLLMGKTVFVYDPFLDNFFKNNNIDLLTTKSASKIMGNGWDMITGNEGALPFFKGAAGHARDIKIEHIGIKQDRIHNEDIAKISQSTWNYLSSSEAEMIHGQFYAEKMDGALRNMGEMYQNPEMRRMFFDEGLFQDQSVNSMFEGTEGGAALGAAKFAASIGMDPIELGDNMLASAMYRKLIDPIVNQSAAVNGHRFGGKSVLIQSLDPSLRNLRPTIVKGGKVSQYGQVMLPAHEMESSLQALSGKGMTVQAINTKTNEVIDVKDIPFAAGKRKYEISSEEIMDMSLGHLHELVNTSSNGEYELAVITNRYPRTRPNDLSILGLKGFLKKEFGNSMIVNELDVLNIFEGDYDVDKNDYFFMHSKDVYKHVKNVVPIWSQGIDVDQFASEGSSLSLTGKSDATNKRWHEQMSNGGVLKKGIGVVQKMHRSLNWLRDLADVEALTGKDITPGQTHHNILQLKNGSKVTMDYNNADWWHRAVLETQAIIDAGTGVDGSLMRYMKEWKDDFLFPTIKDSALPDELGAGNKIGFLRDQRSRKDGTKRIRLFRKFDANNKEIDLNDIDKAIIRTMLNEYSNFIGLGTSIFERTGQTKKPGYKDVYDMTDQYKTFMKNNGKGGNIARRVFFKLANRFKENDEFAQYFGGLTKQLKYGVDPEAAKPTDFYDINGSLDGPFAPGLTGRAGKVAEGSYGNVFDRLMMKVHEVDPMKVRDFKGFSVEMMNGMDEAMNRFMEHPEYKDNFNADVMSFVTDVNKGISTIKYLKSQFGSISRSNKSYKQQRVLMDGLNEQISTIETKLWEILPESYKKSHKSKDLNDGYIKVLDLNSNKELIDGTVQLYAMDAMASINEGPPQMHKDIADLRALERRFFADNADLSATLKYGDATVTSKRIQEYLKGMPAGYNDIESIIDYMMEQNFKKYGGAFVYHYAKPSKNKNAIGIFNGQSVVVPYSGNGRMRRALRFMAKRADQDPSIMQQMKALAPVLKHYRNYFNKDFKYMSNEMVIDPNVTIPGSSAGLTYEHLQFPDFHQSFETAFDSFRSFKWNRQADPVDLFKTGPDPVINFYTKFFDLYGKGQEFTEYMKQHSVMMNDMKSTKIVDPMRYLAMISNMDADIHKFVGQRFTGYVTEGKNGPITLGVENMNLKSLEGDPIFALLGGSSHFKGLTLNPGKKHNKASLESMVNYSKQANTIVKGRPSEGKMKNLFELMKACGVR